MICKKCGTEFEKGIFCPNCGTKCEGNDLPVSRKSSRKRHRGIYIVIIILGFLIISKWKDRGVREEEGNIYGETFEQQEIGNGNYNDIEAMADMPIYSMDYVLAYIDANGIEIPKAREKDNIEKALAFEAQPVSVKEEKENQYVMTNEQTEYVYFGKTKNNKPDGVGALVKLVSAHEYEENGKIKVKFGEYQYEENEANVVIVLMYAGEFDKGYFSGYGWEYITPFTDSSEMAGSIYVRNLGEDYVQIGNDLQENILATCNPIGYMGEFKKGEYHGDGVEIAYAAREIPVGIDESQMVEMFGYRVDREIGFYIGEFENGVRDGKVKEYLRGKLSYSGEEKEAAYHGKGTSYYLGTDQKKYEGQWRNGYYDGEGILYDENGSVIYKGKWDMGDYAH